MSCKDAYRLALPVVFLAALVIWITACGGGSSHNNSSTTPSTSTSPAMINIGDFPSDQVVACAMTINSITLNGPNGNVTVMSTPTPVEMTRLMGTAQPLALTKIPQGTYTSATINAGSAAISFMNAGNPTPVQQTVSVGSTTVNFSSPVTVGTTPVLFNFDLDLSHSIAIANGTASMTPIYTAAMNTLGAGPQDPEHGFMQVIGSVASTSGNGFGMSMMQSSQLMNFVTNSSTSFDNISGMGMMGGGQILTVNATLQPDGTLLCTKVQLMTASGGVMTDGLIDTNTGTQFTMIAQNGTGSGMMSSMLANMLTISTAGATYEVDTDGVDMTGLPFSDTSFNAATISKCQRTQTVSTTAMGSGSGMMGGGMNMAGTVSASQIRLMQQGFVGTVSNYVAGTPSTFTLTLDPTSAFATLTGKTSITVYQQSDTELQGLTSISNGITVLVRGLLFQTSPGVYQMVACRIMTP